MNMCVHTVTAPDGARSDSGDALVELLGYTKPKGGNLHREKQTSTKKRNLQRPENLHREKKNLHREKKTPQRKRTLTAKCDFFDPPCAEQKKIYRVFFLYKTKTFPQFWPIFLIFCVFL